MLELFNQLPEIVKALFGTILGGTALGGSIWAFLTRQKRIAAKNLADASHSETESIKERASQSSIELLVASNSGVSSLWQVTSEELRILLSEERLRFAETIRLNAHAADIDREKYRSEIAELRQRSALSSSSLDYAERMELSYKEACGLIVSLKNELVSAKKSADYTFFIRSVLDHNQSPCVFLDRDEMTVRGDSYPMLPHIFFGVLSSITTEHFSRQDSLTVSIYVSYMGSSSQSGFTIWLRELDAFSASGKVVSVTWYYPDDDGDAKEQVESFDSDCSSLVFRSLPSKRENFERVKS